MWENKGIIGSFPDSLGFRDPYNSAYDPIHSDSLCSCSLSRGFPPLKGKCLLLPHTCAFPSDGLLLDLEASSYTLREHPFLLKPMGVTYASPLCFPKVFTFGTQKSREGCLYSVLSPGSLTARKVCRRE